MSQKFLSDVTLSTVSAGSMLKVDSNGKIVAAVDGTDYISTSAASYWTSPNSGTVYTNNKVGIGYSNAGAKLHVYEYQTTTPKILIEDGNTGDASIQFKVSAQQYTVGIDNSDSDKFVIAASSALGTTNALEIATDGLSAFQKSVLFNDSVYLATVGATTTNTSALFLGTQGIVEKRTLGSAAFSAATDFLGATAKAADSDKLDGIDSSSFLRSDDTDTASGAISFTSSGLSLSGHYYQGFYSGTNNYIHLYPQSHTGAASTTYMRAWTGTSFRALKITGNSNDITWGSHKLWTSGNDGSGSGLDADTLDGSHASDFAAATHTHTLSEITDAGTAAAADTTDFATAAQGALADTALQSLPSHNHDTRYYTKQQSDNQYATNGNNLIPINATDSNYQLFTEEVVLASVNEYRGLAFQNGGKNFVFEVSIKGTNGANHQGIFWGLDQPTEVIGTERTGYKLTHQGERQFHIRDIATNTTQITSQDVLYAPNDGQYHRYKIINYTDATSGRTVFKVYVDGNLIFNDNSGAFNTPPQQPTYFGFINYNGDVTFSNWNIREITGEQDIILLVGDEVFQPVGNYLTSLPAHHHDARYYTETEMDGFLAGKLSTSGGTLTGNLSISKNNPVLILNETTSTSDASQVAYISFQDNGSEEAWIGWGSSGNTDFTFKNTIGKVVLNGSSILSTASHTVSGTLSANRIASTNISDSPDIISNIPIVRLHDNSGDYLTSIDSLETFILSKTDGGYGAGTKPSGSHNGVGVISLQTHSTNYFTQLALDTNQNALWIRSANGAASFGSWEQLASRNWVSGLGYATTSYVDTAVSNLVDSAPSTLDTLNELAAALGDDANFSTTVTNSIGTKVSKAGDTMTGSLTIDTGTNGSTTQAYTAFDRIIFNNQYNDVARGANKIVLYDDGASWMGGFGIHDDTVAYYSGGTHKWYKVNSNSTYTERMTLDASGNLSIDGTLTASGYNKSNWDTAYGWGNHSDAGYLTSVPSTFSATQITLGSGVVLRESSDRADLLSISSSTSSWGGLQVTNSSNEALGSFMVNDSSLGLYDDQQNEWIMLYSENAGTQHFYNGSAKMVINSAGAKILNTLELGNYSDTNQGILALNGNVADRQSIIKTTNGNLHIDSHDGYSIYLNYYTGTADNIIFGNGNGGTSGAKVTSGGVIYATGGNSGNWNTAYGWGNHASQGYLTSVPSTFSATSITIGNAVTLSESTDRADLLSISSGTSGWGGLQITNTAGEGIWSFMVDGSAAGIYDDQNGDWAIYCVENSYVELRHNASGKLATKSTGVTVTGRMDATSDVGVGAELNLPNVHSASKIQLHGDDGDAHCIGTSSFNNTYGPVNWTNGTLGHVFFGATNSPIAILGNGGSTAGDHTSTFFGSVIPNQDRLWNLGGDVNRWRIVFCEILDSAGQHEKNLQNPEGEKSVGEYETGTVLVWKGGKNVPCTTAADHMRMGIAVKGIDSPLIQGAEPVLVTGSVNEGDYLVTSGKKEGHAEAISPSYMRQHNLFDCVLGKALESAEGESHLVKTWINI